MYPDPKRIRDNRLTVRFDDYEEGLVRALAAYLGVQPTTLIRNLALRQAEELLGIQNAADNSSLPRKTA